MRLLRWLALALGVFPAAAQTLYNGIALPSPWPPVQAPTQAYRVPAYVPTPPSVIPIDTGRQLFVDDFLIEQTTLTRTPHRPVMWPFNPVLSPGGPDASDMAMPYSDGVWYDPADHLYKMWYYGGYGNVISYAYSTDGRTWVKPSFADAVVPGTNMVLQLGGGRDSNTVWMDLEDADPSRKFKAFSYVSPGKMQVNFSADGIHWGGPQSYYINSLSDRTTIFWNPFRKIWVDSMRRGAWLPATDSRAAYYSRSRYYAESSNLSSWTPSDWISSFWTGPDDHDPPYAGAGGAPPELYNLDAVGYESLMVGLFSWYHPGPDYDPSYAAGPNIVEIGVGFSRDGFNWVRPTRGQDFIPVSNVPGTWNGFNTQSAGGAFLVVGDELWFYFSGRTLKKPLSGVGSTGMAMLRRDGFYSMDAGASEGTLTTRPVRFSGSRFFVNADTAQGVLRAEVLDASGAVIAPFSKANSSVVSVNKTMQEVTWSGASDLSALAGRTVKIRFYLTNGSLYAFWVANNALGASNGYVAAGGPGFTGPIDNLGSAAMPAVTGTPVIAPAGGTSDAPPQVTLLTSTVGATIRYTIDGTDPTGSSTLYTAPFTLPGSRTVKARAFSSLPASAIASAVFTVRDANPPTVNVTYPMAGQTVSGSVTATANASDDVGVAGVQFKLDGANLGEEDTAAPYSTTLDTVIIAAGSHTITAVARDIAGNTTTSAGITFTAAGDTTKPTVAITAPAAGARVSRTIAVSADASDNVGVVGVQFKLDGANLQGEFLTAPYSLSLDTTTLTNGTHTFTAVARDRAGNSTTSSGVSVTVDNDLVLPVVAITAPTSGQTLSGSVAVRATATDNVGVVGVQFQLDGSNFGAELIAAPYTLTLNTTALVNGAHALSATARDAWGNRSSATVSFNTLNDLLPPVVAFTAPTDGQAVFGSININATATDDVGVVGVQFNLDGVNLGTEVTAPPYSAALDTRTVPDGNHTIAAIGRDAVGHRTTVTITVKVSNYVLPGAPLAYWAFEPADISGNRVLDRTEYHADATYYSSTFVPGLHGNAISMAGSGYAVVSTYAHLNLRNDMTICAWIRTTNSTRLEGIFSKYDAGDESGYILRTTAGGYAGMRIGATNAGGTRREIVDTRKINDGAWHHVAAVLKLGVGVSFYIDGTLSTTWAVPLTASNGGREVNIGRVPWTPHGYPFRGDIDQVRVYGQAVPAEQIYGLVQFERNTVPDITAPSVTLTAPTAGQTLSGTVTLSASASDDTGVLGVQFRVDGTDFGAEKISAPYTASLDTNTLANGSHSLTVSARDAAGNRTTSAAVSVTVANDHSAPSVTMTGPAAGQTLSGTVTLAASASDDVGVVGVQFLADGANIGAERTSAPYSLSLDTNTLTNGAHSLAAVARDAAGNRTTAPAVSVSVLNDVVAPSVSVSSPTSGQTVSGTITVAAAASDNVGVAGVQLKLDGANLGAEKTAAPYSVSIDSNTLANGAHTVAAVARDAAGNSTTSLTVSFTVNNDHTAPVVSISSPAAGQTVTGAITVAASASDNVGVTGVQLLLDGANLGAEKTAAPYSTSLDTVPLSNGVHTVAAVARDAAGNNATAATVSFTVNNDKTAPTVSISTPTAGQILTGTFTVTAAASDNVGVAGVQLLLDGASLGVEDTAAPYSTTLDANSLANGTHTVAAIARDAAGNSTTSATVSFTVDHTAPTVSVTSPTAGQMVTGTLTVGATASDNLGVAGVQLLLDGANFGAEKTASPYTASLDTASLANGAHTMAAVARDAAGNRTTSATVSFTVDRTAPTVSVSSPTAGQTVSGSITFTAAASDNVGVAGVQLLVDGANFGTEDTAAPYSASLDTTTLTNGSHTLTATARDAAGNRTTSTGVSVTVSNDRVNPTVAITYPAAGQTIAGVVGVTATASDNVGVAGVQFLLDGFNLGAEDTTAPYATTLDTSTLANATHTLAAIARDAAGNRTTSTVISITVYNDHTLPVVSISSPAAGQTVYGTITITAAASDNVGVAGVQFLVDGVAFGAEDTAAPYTVSLNTNTLANGAHSVAATARDAAGNAATSASFSVTVANVAPITDPPLGKWTFDPADISGALLLDRSTYGANVTAYRTTAIDGRIGGAQRFGGVNSYGDAAVDTHLNLTTDMTVAFWIRTTKSGRYEGLVGKYDASGSETGWLVRTTATGTLGVRLGGNNLRSGLRDVADTVPINDGAWHHVAVVFRLGSGVSFFIDGMPTSTVARDIIAARCGTHFNIGRNPYTGWGNYFTGDLDQVVMYSRALSGAEVSSLFRNGG